MTMALEDIKVSLPGLIDSLAPGDVVILTRNQHPVARLVNEPLNPKSGLRPPPGLGKGFITVISDDEDHLEHFREYMQ